MTLIHPGDFAHELSGPTAQEIAHPSSTKLPDDIASKKIRKEQDEAKVSAISMKDILENRVTLPFTQRNGWKNIQDEDKIVQTLKRHMQSGTIPQRRGIKQPEIKKIITYFSTKNSLSPMMGWLLKLKQIHQATHSNKSSFQILL